MISHPRNPRKTHFEASPGEFGCGFLGPQCGTQGWGRARFPYGAWQKTLGLLTHIIYGLIYFSYMNGWFVFVGKRTIHGWYGLLLSLNYHTRELTCPCPKTFESMIFRTSPLLGYVIVLSRVYTVYTQIP